MTTDVLDDKALRKAWLKQNFALFEYHEEMLGLHRKWLNVIRAALAAAENDISPGGPGSGFGSRSQQVEYFKKRFLPLLERNDDLGKYRKDEWSRLHATATFRSIPDYGRYMLSEEDALNWMTEQEHAELGMYWGPMSRMAQNIQYTVDDRWDDDPNDCDWILVEKYTGPITWPANWREEILGTKGAVLAAMHALRVRAGDPAPQSGLWQAVDITARQLHVNVGDKLPGLTSTYGITIWQRVGD